MVKQHISVDQLNELTLEQQESLRQWWEPKRGDKLYGKYKYRHMNGEFFIGMNVGVWDAEEFREDDVDETCLPLLSIGQCIEILVEFTTFLNITNIFAKLNMLDIEKRGWGIMAPMRFDIRSDILIDALWEAVKEVL